MQVHDRLRMFFNEIQDVIAHVIAGNPGSPVEGQFWYDTTANRLKYRTDAANVTPWTANGDIPNSEIALAKLATDPLARAGHTGTQLAATISDFDTQVRTNRLDQMANPTANVSMNSQRITNVADGTGSNDAVNLQQLQSAISGLSWKDSVRAASTANVVIATALENGDALDGVTLATGDRVLLKNQSTAAENGIYVVAASGAAVRASDADTAAELESAAVMVEEGSTNSATQWLQTAVNFTLNSGAVTWIQFGGSTTYTAGDGLTLTGNDFDVGAGNGITVDATSVAVDPAVVGRKYTTTFDGNGSLQTFTITHNLNNANPIVQVWDTDATPDEIVMPTIFGNSANAIDVFFGVAPANLATYRVMVIG